MIDKNVHGKSITIIGAARSGVAVARLLQRKGASVFVSDHQPAAKLERSIAEFIADGIPYEAGEHSSKAYECDLMVISPGVPSDAAVVLEAQRRKITIFSELEIASWYCGSPVVAITGSNGKTTTTTLLGRMVSDARKKAVVAGNIGDAFSNYALDLQRDETAILEVSSFQLDFIQTFRPSIAMILNITQNHMDRYKHSMELYAASKARITMNQQKEDTLITNADDFWTASALSSPHARHLEFSTQQQVAQGASIRDGWLVTNLDGQYVRAIAIEDISIKGEHNLQNAMAATLAAQLLGISIASIRSTLRNFKGVEHRQEFVREFRGVKFINDSKATTVEAVSYALRAYHEPLVLILGGKDKGNDYSTITSLVRERVRAVVAIGLSASTVEKAFSGIVPVVRIDTIGDEIPNVRSMAAVIDAALGLAHTGDNVLLSPACTSFDWFSDYEERGKVFKSLVKNLVEN